MNAMEEETPLSGGRVTSGVVRIGNTVRRPLGPNSTFVHALLRHLESAGYSHAPRLLGVDPQGREVLTFVPGTVPTDLGYFSESQVREAARIIARLHDATAGTPLAGNQEVVCHGDLSPCNFVLRFDVPVCLIDFDTAFRGPRRLDVGYAAWTWLDIGNSDQCPLDSGQRLAAFLDAYGSRAPSDPINAILEAQAWLAQRTSEPNETPVFTNGVHQWSRGCIDWVRENRRALEAGLRGRRASERPVR